MNNLFLPRGIRNHNPGNLKLAPVLWQGQKAPSPEGDPVFAEFIAPIYGLRALMKLLLTYHLKYGLDTVQSVINRFAPPSENATDSYIYAVAKRLQVGRMEGLNLLSKKHLTGLAKAIVLQENGRPPKTRPDAWYDAALYDQAAELVLPTTV